MTTTSGRWLAGEPAPDAPMRLFCFPHAGAGPSTYRPWSAALAPAGISVCPIQLPGREARFGEAPVDRWEPIVEAITRSITPHLDRPFALFGHSLGALLAFEVARSLRRRRAPLPAHLYVSGRIAPHLRDPRPLLHVLPDAELIAELTELGGMPALVLDNPELLALHLPVVRADLAVNETYRYRAETPLSTTLTALGGDADPKVQATELAAWAEHTTARFTQRTAPGGHFYLATSLPWIAARMISDLAMSTWFDTRDRA